MKFKYSFKKLFRKSDLWLKSPYKKLIYQYELVHLPN